MGTSPSFHILLSSLAATDVFCTALPRGPHHLLQPCCHHHEADGSAHMSSEKQESLWREIGKKKWIPSLASRTAAAVNRKWLFVSPPSSQRLVTCSCHPHISSKTHTGCRVRMGLTPGTFSSCLPLRSGAVLSTWEVTASIQHGNNPSGDFIRQRIQHRH